MFLKSLDLRTHALALCTLGFVAAACTHTEAPAPTPTAPQAATTEAPAPAPVAVKVAEGDVKYKIYTFVDKDLTKVAFKAGSSDLNAAEKKQLADFVAKTKSEAKLDKIIVASWSDKEYPTVAEKDLGKHDTKLAKQRADVVKKSLEKSGAKSVDTFTMTKHPNWIQEVFSTESAEVKGEARTAKLSNELTEQIGQRLREQGGPGKVVVIAKFKDEVVPATK